MQYTSTKKNNSIFFCFFLAALLFPAFTQAHPMTDVLNKLSGTEAVLFYLKLGFQHILPLGFDHILFIVSLFLLNPQLKPILWQATAFTVAHCITLGLSMYQVISPPAHIVEPVIALSIMFVSIENILTDKLKKTRLVIVFVFGLIHGLGFAGALGDIGLPDNKFFSSLLAFNAGVELGQIAVILLCWFLCVKWCREKPWYRKRLVIPVSAMIALTAFYWTIERTFF